MHRSLTLIACIAISSAAAAQNLQTKIYRGAYFHNFETSAFTPEGSDETWCVKASEMTRAQVPGSKSGRAKVVVRGELSHKGKFCNMGAYAHILKVVEIIEATEVTSE